MSEYEQEYYPETEEEWRRRRRLRQIPTLEELATASEINSKRELDSVNILEKERKIRERAESAHLARITSNVVERGQHMVAAGLVKVFRYEKYWKWSLYESKKGIFSHKVREENEEEKEDVYVEGYE